MIANNTNGKQKKGKKKRMALLALLSAALIFSMLLAGTYSWFVMTDGGEEPAAILEGAFIDLTVTYDANNPIPVDIVNGAVINCPSVYNVLWQNPNNGADSNDPIIIYPGEGLKYSSNVELINNREVVLKVDFNAAGNSLEAQLDAIAQGLELADANDPYTAFDWDGNLYGDVTIAKQIFIDFNVGSNSSIFNPEIGIYYIFVPAGGLTETFDAIIGIDGLDYDQNDLMEAGLTFNSEPKIRAVQGTTPALLSVFQSDLDKANSKGLTLEDWILGLEIHDALGPVTLDYSKLQEALTLGYDYAAYAGSLWVSGLLAYDTWLEADALNNNADTQAEINAMTKKLLDSYVDLFNDTCDFLKFIITNATPGSTLTIPEGTYDICCPITIPNGISLDGVSKDKVIFKAKSDCDTNSDRAIFVISDDGTEIKNITFDFTDMPDKGGYRVIRASGKNNIVVQGNEFIGVGTSETGAVGIELLGGESHKVIDNTFDTIGNRAILLDGTSGNSLVSGNEITVGGGSTRGAIQITATKGGSIEVSNNKISGVWARDHLGGGSSAYQGAAIHLYDIHVNTNIIVQGNEIKDSHCGIYIYKADAQVTVKNNSFENSTYFDVACDGLNGNSYPVNVEIFDNTSDSPNVNEDINFWGVVSGSHAGDVTITVDSVVKHP